MWQGLNKLHSACFGLVWENKSYYFWHWLTLSQSCMTQNQLCEQYLLYIDIKAVDFFQVIKYDFLYFIWR